MKRKLTSIAAAALVLGSMAPAAFAATGSSYTDITSQYSWAAQDINNLTSSGVVHGFSDNTYRPAKFVTRGQLLAYFWNLVNPGVKPVANAQFFSDVAPGNWDFNYVGAAYNAGWINQYWINVRPGYAFHLNYHASWGDAASFAVAYMKQNSTTFTTNGMAPLAWAKANGLFQGIPSTENQTYLDRASAAVFLANVGEFMKGQLLPAGATVTVTGSANVAPNSVDQLSVVVKLADGSTYTLPSTASIQWSVDNKNGFFNSNVAGQLITTTAGTYNVVATVDGVQSTPYAIDAYGAMTSLSITPAVASPVANGVSSDLVTVKAVDAAGNTVGNFNGTATVALTTGLGTTIDTSTNQAADVSSATSTAATLTFTNGVATMNVISGTVPGLTSVYTFTYTPTGASTAQTGTLSMTTVPQVATGLQVTSPSPAYVSANAINTANFNVEVVDQSGNPMLSGSWAFNVGVTGPGTLVSPTSGVYSGNGTTTASPAVVSVDTEQGVTGAIAVTATATGLATGTGSVQAVIGQAPVKFVPSTTTASFAEGSTGAAVTVSPVDVNGYPATWPTGTYTVYVNNSSGSAATNILVNGMPESSTGITLPSGGALNFTDTSVLGTPDAGTYTVTVKDSSGNTWATFPVVETAATASAITVSVPAQYVTQAGASNVPVTLQLQDQYGNNVAQANTPISLYYGLTTGTVGTATLNGTNANSAGAAITVTTNSNGTATATLDAQPYAGDTYTVSAVPGANAGFNAAATSAGVTVESDTVSNVSVSLADTSNSSSYVTAGQSVTGVVYLKDGYGNYVTNSQNVTLTVNGGLSNVAISPVNGVSATLTGTASPYTVSVTGGWFKFTATATTSGAASVVAADTSIAPNPSSTGSITVLPGTATQYAFFNAQGQEITSSNELTVAANTPTEVWLKPVDSQGNPGISTGAGNAIFNDNVTSGHGSFRVNSVNYASSASTLVAAGTASIPVWYVNSTAGSYNLSTASEMVTNGQFTAVTGQTNQYASTLTFYNTSSNAFNPNSLTVTGYTYSSTTPTAGTSGVYTINSVSNNVYTVTLYTNGTLTAQPTISYTF